MKNLGMVSLKSIHGHHLQAHTDGELHGSNDGRNEEETWFLIEVNPANHVYALQNWRNGKYLSLQSDRFCARASSAVLSPTEQWVFVPGAAMGVVNAVAIKALTTGTFLRTNNAGDDTRCGGEVAANSPEQPRPTNHWNGWWVMAGVGAPSPGRDFWNTVGGAVGDIANKINPADVAAILATIL
jgi:hypothetical protein